MRNIVKPESLSQNGLFDTEKFGWWHTQLAPEAFRRLSNGMEGVFRASILKLMPAVEIGEAFDPQIGADNKGAACHVRASAFGGISQLERGADGQRVVL